MLAGNPPKELGKTKELSNGWHINIAFLSSIFEARVEMTSPLVLVVFNALQALRLHLSIVINNVCLIQACSPLHKVSDVTNRPLH